MLLQAVRLYVLIISGSGKTDWFLEVVAPFVTRSGAGSA
jgi:hypothetical protein